MKTKAISWLYDYGPPVVVQGTSGAPLNAVGEIEDGGGGGSAVVVAPPAVIVKVPGCDLSFGNALTPAVGTVSIPDPGVLPNQCVFIAKMRGPASGNAAVLAGQFDASGQFSWLYWRIVGPGVQWGVYPQGTVTGSASYTASAPTPDATKDEWIAMAVTINNGAGNTRLQAFSSADGATWTSYAETLPGVSVVPFDSNNPVRIGAGLADPASTLFDGRIYSVELRTGLSPEGEPTGRYLVPTTGTVTTPNPGPLPADCTFVFKVRGPAVAYAQVASQSQPGVATSWLLAIAPGDNVMYFNSFADGTTPSYGYTPTADPTGQDQWRALSVQRNNGAGRQVLTERASTDGGATWTQVATADYPTVTPIASANALTVGQTAFDGRIYSVELRTGLSPTGGSVLWRFDANEAPTDGTTTTWTDPRGRQWTATNPLAITGRTLWKFNADDYPPGGGTTYVDPRGRTWTLTAPGCIALA